ncbi:MAG: HAMP domain-containing histidine kinase [Gammaproteobacteria bacterium]|nr:HAMP domain-containing histidine kinase [Gammaproteobacteria bacterium]
MPVPRFLVERREVIILALMLESLHIALWGPFPAPSLMRAGFMMIHLGLFLLWQPFWRGNLKLAWYNGLLFIGLAILFVFLRNWWLRAGWVIVLIGVFGGSIGTSIRERRTNLLVLAFLTFQLAIPCATTLFSVSISDPTHQAFAIIVGAIPLVLLAFPVSGARSARLGVDPVYAIAASTLVTLLVVGSLLIMYRGRLDYLTALIWTLTAIGGAMLIISWLLTPHMGFSGLAQLWQRVIINVGTPFEGWLSNLATVFTRAQSPGDFLQQAMKDLSTLDWIAGVQWEGPEGTGSTGHTASHNSFFALDPLAVRVHTHLWLGGALHAHCRLLVQVINHFYSAKYQERELTRQAHLSAIYQTGARVTHDIKNLLQSLQALTSVIASDRSEAGTVSRQLLRRQLPHLTQRLQLALDKLQAPAGKHGDNVFIKDWWHDFQLRNPDPQTAYHTDIIGDPLIPVELFDSVAENLLENIRAKRHVEPDIRTEARVVSDGTRTYIEMCDSGSAIAPEKAGLLLNAPVSSENGLGIGLYQAALQAQRAGYALTLESNEEGRVCFRLTGNAK